ncbi:MAG: NAD(P)/FAD-dependent oxidoreductase [Acidobacteriota bacterium]
MVIAGAGPSGLAAAIHLCRSGHPVEAYERRESVGARFIGEYQVLENYTRRQDVIEELAAMGIEANFELRPASWARLFDDRSRSVAVASSRPYGYFLRRGPEPGTLDRGLEAQARRLGARLHFGKKIPPEEADIVATGPGPADGIAKEIAFRTNSPDRIEVIFDPELAPGGYAYFFALEGWATLGLALLKSYGRLEAHFERTVERFQLLAPFDIQSRRRGYSYMNFFLRSSSERRGSLFAGEAGGFQDYLFGLGIRYALVSGHLAARSLVDGVDFDRLWSERFLTAMRSSVSSRLLYEAVGKYGLRFFVWQAGRTDFRDFLYAWARPSWWKLAIRPLAEKLLGKAERCAHKLPCGWCRTREGRAGEAEPLPADFVSRYLVE